MIRNPVLADSLQTARSVAVRVTLPSKYETYVTMAQH